MPRSSEVEVFMTEQEALWDEWERIDSKQGSSTDLDVPLVVLSEREITSQEAGPNNRNLGEEEVDSDDIEVVYFEDPEVDELDSIMSHPGEKILLINPRSKVTNNELKQLRYLYKFPRSVEVRALEAHEKVN